MSKKPLTILFDANPLLGKRTGVGHYTARLIKAMAEISPQTQFVGYYYNFLGRKTAPSISAPNISFSPILCAPGPVIHWLRRIGINVPIEILTFRRSNFILYSNFLGYPSLFKTPQTSILYDLTYLDVPGFGSDRNVSDLKRYVPQSIRRASFIITISAFSQQRIIQAYGVAKDSFVTTFIPPDKTPQLDEQAIAKVKAKFDVTKPFLLTIGTLEPRKNIESLLAAYKDLPPELRDKYSLLLAGGYDWKFEAIKQEIETMQADGYDVKYLGYVSDLERAALYQSARLYVMASFYEGFGMPIIEALGHGVPCAVSDIPVLHEVGGNVVSYFDPHDVQNISKTITECLSQPSPPKTALQQHVADLPSWPEVGGLVMERINRELSLDRSAA